ncbi:MAG: hypothetical protein LQ350_004240 [Teloschistes chrysophthalmus]|nr:MAG: hypothetical protein LQ350_004240 [Niorma chrysophthalma]
MGKSKKRKHAQITHDDGDQQGQNVPLQTVGDFLARASNPTNHERPESQKQENKANGGEDETWTVVGKGGKKRKIDNYPALVYAESHKQQCSLKIDDLQKLVLYCLADDSAPQWISIRHHFGIKKAVVLFVPGLERGMFDGSVALNAPEQSGQGEVSGKESDVPAGEAASHNVPSSIAVSQAHSSPHNPASPDAYLPVRLAADKLPEPLKPLADCFQHLWPVQAPGDDSRVFSPLHMMLNSKLPKSQEQKRAEKATKGPKPVNSQYWQKKRTQVAHFICSEGELEDNDFVLHPAWFEDAQSSAREVKRREDAKQTAEYGWMDTEVEELDHCCVPNHQIEQGSITAGRKPFAIDCEMCKVEGDTMALTRISIVDWDGSVVMDELVKPDKPITDYLTRFSGITAEKLEPVTTDLGTVQKDLYKLLTPQSILIGHSVNSDLEALKLTHPFIIDTSILYQHPRGPPMKSSLKWLAQKYLCREIQKGHGTHGHDSVEDARACLDLVKMKCEKGPEWGTSAIYTESIFKRLARTPPTGTGALPNGAQGKSGAIIDHGSPEKSFRQMAPFSIGCNTDAEVVEAVKRAVLGDPDGSYIPGGGVDFTWARMRELETLRGWKNDHRYDRIHMNNDDDHENPTNTDPSPTELAAKVTETIAHIRHVHASLPPCTLLVVYSGTGDPRELARLQQMQRTFKAEYKIKNWDQLSVKWTDTEEQAMKRACKKARRGVGFITTT